MGRALGDGPWQRRGGEEEPVMFGHEWWGGEGRREQVGSKVDCREKIRALVRWRLLCRQSSFSGDGLYAFCPAVLTHMRIFHPCIISAEQSMYNLELYRKELLIIEPCLQHV